MTEAEKRTPSTLTESTDSNPPSDVELTEEEQHIQKMEKEFHETQSDDALEEYEIQW